MIHINISNLLGWLHSNSKHILDVMISPVLGRSQMKWHQRPDMTIAVDWKVKKHQKQRNNRMNIVFSEADLNEIQCTLLPMTGTLI